MTLSWKTEIVQQYGKRLFESCVSHCWLVKASYVVFFWSLVLPGGGEGVPTIKNCALTLGNVWNVQGSNVQLVGSPYHTELCIHTE